MAKDLLDAVKVITLPDGSKGLDFTKAQTALVKEHLADFIKNRADIKGKTPTSTNLIWRAGTKHEIPIKLGKDANLFKEGQPISRFNAVIKGGLKGPNWGAIKKSLKFAKFAVDSKDAALRKTGLEIGTLDPKAKGNYKFWNRYLKGIMHHSGPAKITSELVKKIERLANPNWTEAEGITSAGKNFLRNLETRVGIPAGNSLLNFDFYKDSKIHNKAHRILEDVGLDTKGIEKVIDQFKSPDEIYQWAKNTYKPGINKVTETLGDFSLRGKNMTRGFASQLQRNPKLMKQFIKKNEVIQKGARGISTANKLKIGAVVGGSLPFIGLGVDAAQAGVRQHQYNKNPSIRNLRRAAGGYAILADQFSPFGVVGQTVDAAINYQGRKPGDAKMSRLGDISGITLKDVKIKQDDHPLTIGK